MAPQFTAKIMKDEKVKCEDCGVLILPRTYEKTGGYCMPCSWKRTPPKPPSPEEIEWLRKMNEEARLLFRKWFPGLQKFATNCRKQRPIPKMESLSELELSEYEVLKGKMLKFAESGDCQLLGHPDTTTIITSSAVGLIAANEIFAGRFESAVFLADDEYGEWWEKIYQHDYDAPWWFVKCGWSVRDHLTEIDLKALDKEVDSSNVRVITSGLQWGSMAGGAKSELWTVEGNQFKFVQGLLDMQF